MKLRFMFAAALAVFVFCSGCSGEQAPKGISTAVSKSLALLPENTNILFYTNLKNLTQTPLGEDLKSELEKKIKNQEEEQDYLEFVEKTGLDLKKDIHEILVAAVATDNSKDENGAIVHGKFNQDKIVNYFKKEKPHKYREDTYEGYKIYIFNDEHETAFLFLNSKTLVLGKLNWLQKVILQSKNGKSSVLNNLVMAKLIDQVVYKDQIWGILNIKELTTHWVQEIRKRGSGFKGTKSLENMQWIIFYANVKQKAEVVLEGNCGTEEEAQLLAEMLNGFKAMAKLSVYDDKEAIDMLNDIKISTKESKIKVSTKVDRKFFEKLEAKSKKFAEKEFDWI